MTTHDVVYKLIGPITPTEDHLENSRRLKNLRDMTSLVDKLLFDIEQVAEVDKDRRIRSVAAAAKVANKFLRSIENEH